jgi:hypothetical protein
MTMKEIHARYYFNDDDDDDEIINDDKILMQLQTLTSLVVINKNPKIFSVSRQFSKSIDRSIDRSIGWMDQNFSFRGVCVFHRLFTDHRNREKKNETHVGGFHGGRTQKRTKSKHVFLDESRD